MFGLLAISPEEQRAKFGFLLDALGMGAPPHGGIASGIDRLLMALLDQPFIRELVAFPKNQAGVDPMSGAPTRVEQAQLDEPRHRRRRRGSPEAGPVEMPRRSIRRFALEVLFLAGVAAAATIAELRPAGVIVLVALAWAVVALLEWTAWLDEPHYGRGLPPRYYVPNTALPPPRAVVPGGARYPAPRPRTTSAVDDAPTFVASATEWSTELADWTLLDSPGEETVVAAPGGLRARPCPARAATAALGVRGDGRSRPAA